MGVTLDDLARGALSGEAGSYDAAAGIYTFTGTAVNATSALRALLFNPAANRVTPGSTRFTITADDGLVSSTDTATSVVSTSVNDTPSISGTATAQSVDENASLRPFSGVTVGDADSQAQQMTVRVALDNAAKGALSNLGRHSYDPASGIYTFRSTAADVTAALRALLFTPTANRVTPGWTKTTRVIITADDGQARTSASTSVSVSSINDSPVLSLPAGLQSVADKGSLAPFANMTVTDADSAAQQLTLRIMLDDPGSGKLSGAAGR